MFKGQVSGPNVPQEFEALVEPHIDSFDHFLGEGMQLVVESLEPIEASQSPALPSCTLQGRILTCLFFASRRLNIL